MQRFLSPAKKLVVGAHHSKPFYPFGKARAIDVLADFIPSPSQDLTKVLLLNCTDLHTTLKTVAASSTSRKQQSQALEIHLNNSCTLNVARNLFFFHVISRNHDFSPTEQDFQYLWDVWFNLEWSETTKKRFMSDVTFFLKENNSPSNAIVSPHVFKSVGKIWSGWLSSAASELSDPGFIKKLHQKRISQIPFHLRNPPCLLIRKDLGRAIDVKIPNSSAFYEYGDVVTVGTMPREERSQLLAEVALYYFIENGNFCVDNWKVKVACLNPTFFGPSADQWLVHHSVNPYNSFLPLPPDAIKIVPNRVTFFGRDRNSVYLRIYRLASKYCHQQLVSLLTAFKMNTDYKVFFHNEDPLQLCFNPIIPRCDVVDCSDLADEVGLANVIVSATNKLVQHPSSLLLTETRLKNSSASSHQPNLEEYVKEELCAPLSMIPTLYGVQLATPVRLGSFTHPDEKFTFLFSRSLKWHSAPSFHHVGLDRSAALEKCLNQLKERCNLGQVPQPGSMNTSLTYSYICSGLAQRTGNRRWMQYGINQVDPRRRLSMKTIEDWKEGGLISQLCFSLPFSQMGNVQLTEEPFDLLLTPSSIVKDPNQQHMMSEYSHFLDNIDRQVILSSSTGEIQELQFTFLLPKDHGLESTHCVQIVNNFTEKVLFNVGLLGEMKVDSFTHSYSDNQPQPNSFFTDKESSSSSITCTETETMYKLYFNLPVFFRRVAFVACFPCQSSNQFTLTNEFQPPQELSFPHPVKMEQPYYFIFWPWFYWYAFQKSLYEPLPQDFHRLEKWDSQLLPIYQLQPLESGKNRKDTMSYSFITSHKTMQKDRSLKGYKGLDNLRGLVAQIFDDIVEAKADRTDGVFLITTNSFFPRVEWYLRVHLPLRISPDGNPMLVLSALDTTLAKHLLKISEPRKNRKRLFAEERDKIFKNEGGYFIVPCYYPNKVLEAETAPLFRYLLRYNSTKILPNSWQNKHIVPEPGKPSPWLTTFITPLYPDYPLPRNDKEKMFDGITLRKGLEKPH